MRAMGCEVGGSFDSLWPRCTLCMYRVPILKVCWFYPVKNIDFRKRMLPLTTESTWHVYKWLLNGRGT